MDNELVGRAFRRALGYAGSVATVAAPRLLAAMGGGEAAADAARAYKTGDPEDIYAAGKSAVKAIRASYSAGGALARNMTSSFRQNVTSVPAVGSGPFSSSTGYFSRRRRRMAFRRRRLRFRRRLRRRTFRARRTGLVSRFANGRSPQGRLSTSFRIRRLQPRYLRVSNASQVKYYDFVVTQETFAVAESSLASAVYTFPAAFTGQKAVLFPFESLAVNNSVSGRITDSIRMFRLDLFVEIYAAQNVQCTDSRISVVVDREPGGTIPILADIFDAGTGFFSGSNEVTDTNLYPKVDDRSRFGIVYQQNTPLNRGAETSTPNVYEQINETCKRFTKSIWMRNHRMIYRKNSILGSIGSVASGAVYIALQGGAGGTSGDAVVWSIRGRLVYTDM